MNGYDYVIGILEDAIKSDESLYYSDYIVHIRMKYDYETEWEESNEYVEFVCDHWEWQSDWYGYQENIEVLGFDMVDNLKITNRLPIKSNKDKGREMRSSGLLRSGEQAKAWRLGYERGIYNATIHEGFTPVAWYTLSDSEIEKVEEKIRALKSQSCEELKAKALVERYRNEKFNIRMISTTDDDYPIIMRDLPNKEKYQLLGINDAVFVPLYQVIDEITGIKADIIKRNGVECCPNCMKPITPQQKVGRWIRVDKDKCKCDQCEVISFIAMYPNGNKNYCPNCGAKMKGEKDGSD